MVTHDPCLSQQRHRKLHSDGFATLSFLLHGFKKFQYILIQSGWYMLLIPVFRGRGRNIPVSLDQPELHNETLLQIYSYI